MRLQWRTFSVKFTHRCDRQSPHYSNSGGVYFANSIFLVRLCPSTLSLQR